MKMPEFCEPPEYEQGFDRAHGKFLDLLCTYIKAHESYEILVDDDKNLLRESYCHSLNYYGWHDLLTGVSTCGDLMDTVFDSVKSLKDGTCKSVSELGNHFFNTVIIKIDDKISFLFDDKILDMHDHELDEGIKTLAAGVSPYPDHDEIHGSFGLI